MKSRIPICALIVAGLFSGCGSPEDDSGFSALLSSFKSDLDSHKISAAQEIIEIQYMPPEAVPELFRLLNPKTGESREVRLAVAEALGEPGEDNASRLVELEKVLESETNEFVQSKLQESISRIEAALAQKHTDSKSPE